MENLVLENYGVKLSLLTHDKIELVRQWRNDPRIQATMIYRQEITAEMQEKWFAKLDQKTNLYFIVEYKGEEIGLINIKNIEPEKKCGESGIFIYEEKFQATDLAYRAHLVMFDYAYNSLQLEYTYSHILPDNPKAYRFAEFLGCVRDEMQSSEEAFIYILSAENYLMNKNRIRFINKWNVLNNK